MSRKEEPLHNSQKQTKIGGEGKGGGKTGDSNLQCLARNRYSGVRKSLGLLETSGERANERQFKGGTLQKKKECTEKRGI